jgi:MFS family permease
MFFGMRHNTSAQSKRKGWHSSSSYLSPTSTVSGNIDANDRSRHLTSGFAFQNVLTHGELATDYEARAVFFVGIAPALITLWIQRRVHEPEAWKREIRVEKSETRRLFQGTLGYGVLICASMNAAALFAYWGLFTWMPRFLSAPVAEGGHDLSIAQTSAWIIVMQVGTFFGYILFGYIADLYNRKNTYISFLVIAALLVPVFAFVRSPAALLLLGPLVAFFGTGYFTGFVVIASELFLAPCHRNGLGLQHRTRRQCHRPVFNRPHFRACRLRLRA